MPYLKISDFVFGDEIKAIMLKRLGGNVKIMQAEIEDISGEIITTHDPQERSWSIELKETPNDNRE